MTNQEYEQKRSELWYEYTAMLRRNCASRYVFDQIFDRAFALGKQEKGVKQTSSLEEEIHTYAKMCSFTEEDYTAIRKAVEFGISLSKQDKDADTVIQGWVARDQDGYISLFKDKPIRDTCDKDDIPYGFWDDVDGNCIDLPITLFPDLTWESEPIKVRISIIRE